MRHRRHWWTLAALLPTVIVFWAGACFVWNHFYVMGPFIHDSGWYSHIIWRQGLFPKNPIAADDLRVDYYAVHVSPLVSAASLLSYLFPGDRVSWYVLFQGAIYAPLGLVTALLVGPDGRTLRGAALVAVASLLFALNGQVWGCIGYPHYEIVVPVGIALMLVGTTTSRLRLAWAGLAIAVAAREDGGLHVASFVAAVLACDLTKRPFPVPRRSLVQMLTVSIVASGLMFVVQKVVFHSPGLFRQEYLGEVPFAHLTSTELRLRLANFAAETRFILFPLAASAALAIARRDARLLLGWVVELPWLALNFLAAQPLKSTFELYTGFPFVASIFWVGVYERAIDRDATPASWRRALGMLAMVGAAATLGSWSSDALALRVQVELAFVPGKSNPEAIRSFARTLRTNPRAYGSLYPDPSIVGWVLESWPHDPVLWDTKDKPFEGYDGVVYFRSGLAPGPSLEPWLARSPFHKCGRIVSSEVYMCIRPERPLPPEFTPSWPLMRGMLVPPEVAHREGEAVVTRATPTPEKAIFGPFNSLEAGRWTVVWTMRTRDCAPTGPQLRLDVYSRGEILASRDVTVFDDEPRLDLDLPRRTDALELRAFTGGCTFVIEGVRLEAR